MPARRTQRHITLVEARRARSLRRQGFSWNDVAARYGFRRIEPVQNAIARLEAAEAAQADQPRHSEDEGAREPS